MKRLMYMVGHNYETTLAPNGKTVVTMLFFGIKMPTTKHQTMLHAMSLNLLTLLIVCCSFRCS